MRPQWAKQQIKNKENVYTERRILKIFFKFGRWNYVKKCKNEIQSTSEYIVFEFESQLKMLFYDFALNPVRILPEAFRVRQQKFHLTT